MVAALLAFFMVSCDQEVKTKTYKVTYNANGAVGDVPASIEREEGGTTTVPSCGSLSMKGYDFVGWNTKKDGSGRAYKESQSVKMDSDIALYAQWSIHEYSISYELDGGSYPEGRSNPSTYTIESETFVLYNPVKEGYEFIGWRYKDDSDVLASMNFAIRKGATGDLSIVAVWKALDTYTISYDANCGTGTIKTQSKYKGESLTISSGEDLGRAGYTFSCWNTKADGTGSNYNPNDAYGADADLRLYAKWSPVKYSIKYGFDGGSFPEGSGITEYTIESDTFTLPVPTKAGYVFLGWKAEGSNEAQKTVSIEKGSIGDLSFTAVWRELKKYTVSYNANGGSGSVESQSKLEGSSIAIAEQTGIKRNGYTFACWNTKSDGTGTDYKPNAGYSNDADLVLYAKWSPVKYSITYDLAGGALPAGKSNPSDYTIETKTFTLVNPEKDGYRFLGWKESGSTDATAEKNLSIPKGSTGNKSFFSVWEQLKKYTITFNSNGADGAVPISLEVYEGNFFTVPLCGSLFKNGCAFYGWNTESDGSGTLYKPSELVAVCEDVVLYAVWNVSPLEYTYLAGTDSYSVGCKDKNVVSIVIPSTYNGRPVSSVKEFSFSGCDGLTELVISSGVASIDYGAFANCYGLESIHVAEGNPKYYAEGNCLIERDTMKLVSGCKNSIIPENVTSIGSHAFWGCRGLTDIVIPPEITSIDYDAFMDCRGLESIRVAEGNPKYYAEGNCLIERDTMKLVRGCKNSIIPEDVTSIGNCAFSGCRGLSEITIPSRVECIGNCAFFGCSDLTEITIPEGVTYIYDQAFAYCSGLTRIRMPEGVREIGYGAFESCSNLVNITIPSSVKYIDGPLFKGCENLEVVFAEGVTEIMVIGYYSIFYGASDVSVTIPSTVTSIGSNVFGDCSSLSVVFAKGMKTIPVKAFRNASGVVSVTIPSTVTSIGYSAFSGCSGLTRIVYSGTKAQWNSITKGSSWNFNTGDYTIHCTDGDIAKN